MHARKRLLELPYAIPHGDPAAIDRGNKSFLFVNSQGRF